MHGVGHVAFVFPTQGRLALLTIARVWRALRGAHQSIGRAIRTGRFDRLQPVASGLVAPNWGITAPAIPRPLSPISRESSMQ
jgi:hypothetical protein